MRVIGICGSARKGNTEWMLKTTLEAAAESGGEVELLLLRKLDVRRCLGCLSCADRGAEKTGTCKIKDDMLQVLPKIIAADVIILASPGYFDMISGLLKNFLDRTCPIWPRLAGKKIAGIAVAEEGIGQTIQNIKTYGNLCNMHWAGSVSTLAKNPGDAASDGNLKLRLRKLAKKLVS